MTKIAQPSQGRRAKQTSLVFIKPPIKKSIAVISTSGLVFGLGIAGSSFAYALPGLCSGHIITPEGTPLEQAQDVMDGLEDGIVCLQGDFVIGQSIYFTEPLKIIGSEGTSITTPMDFTNPVFDTSYPDALIEIENTDISSHGQVVRGYDVRIRDSVFAKSGNFAPFSGGAIYSEGGSVTISNSTISGFDATGDGGAIWAAGDVTISSDSRLSSNEADDGGGGGAIFALGSVTISNSTLSENIADGEGGAILGVGAVNVSNSTLSENNSLANVGGAISGFSAVTISNSTLTNNSSSTGGGAIYAAGSGDLTISNSTLTDNTAGSEGGAIFSYADSNISNSTLSENTAGASGGAIYGFETSLTATNSTFFDNSALNGGAMYSGYGAPDYAGGTVDVSNSTFVDNKATDAAGEGGAIFAYDGEILFSTFVNNLASTPDPDEDTPGNAIYKTGTGLLEIGANIFSGASADPQLGIGALPTGFSDMGGNVFSTLESTETPEIEEISESTLFGKSLSLLFGTSSPVLATYTPNTSNTQTIGLAAVSPALGIVPDTAPFNTYTLDQRGATRIDPRDAGAFQGVAPVGGGVSSADFTIFSLPTGITKPGAEVKASGANLNLVKEVYVNGNKVKIKKQSAASLVFTVPRGLTGPVDVRFVSASSQYTAFRALDFGSSAASGTKARTVVGGFAANSTRLSMKMKREIRTFLKSNPGFSTVTCIGFTSEPATALDSALAKARGQVTCNFVKKIDSELKVKVVQGRHTEQPGSKIRRVRITLE